MNSAVSYLLYAHKGALLSAYQRMDIQSMISACIMMFMNCGQILVLLYVRSYYCYIMLMPVFTVLNNLAVAAAATRLFPDVADNEKVLKEDFFNMTAIAESTPGPVAINSATYIGYRVAGFRGAAASTLAISHMRMR